MYSKLLSPMALADAPCLKLYAEATYNNLFGFYSEFPGSWDLLWIFGRLGSIIVITGALYSGIAWVSLAVLNLTGNQHPKPKPNASTN
jgi:hypothetical protein